MWEAHYDNGLECGKRTTRKLNDLPNDYGEVFADLSDPVHIYEWSTRLGVELEHDETAHGSGLHVMDSGGWLQVHLDFARNPSAPNKERRLSLVVFLHPEWEPHWGGQLLLCDATGKPVTEIEPVPGRLVAWEASDLAYHGVRRTKSPVCSPRIAATMYLMSSARPEATRQRALFLPNRNEPECPLEVS